MKTCGLLIIGLFMGLPGVIGQDDPVIRRDYNQLSFSTFVESLERDYPVRFFFRREWIDSIAVVQAYPGQPLRSILEATMNPHPCSFLMEEDRIYLFPGPWNPPSLRFVNADTASAPRYSVSYETSPSDSLDSGEGAEHRLVEIGRPDGSDGNRATLNGTIREAETGEPVIGAVVFNEDQQVGVTTDVNGYYVITLSKGRHQVTYRSVGMQEEFRNILLLGDGSLNIEMKEKVTRLKGVVITADRYQNVSGMQVGLNRIDVSTIRQVPAAMGEVDVLKAALLLPGVQTVGEGASGFNVRGGSTDQNLILFNGAPVFNTSHLFGFFSAFNPDVIREFKLFKSGIPAEYGGRISSVFDISTRSGNRKNLSGQGGISPITGRLVLEGPLVRERASFLLGGRSTYSDWLLKRIEDPAIQNSSAAFYDLNGKISFEINKDNLLDISAYLSNDYFNLNTDTTYRYDNAHVTASWRRVFNSRLIGRFSGLISHYKYQVNSDSRPQEAFSLRYHINHREATARFTFFPRSDHKIIFGFNGIHYNLLPGSYQPVGDRSLVLPRQLEEENGIETALYLSDEIRLTDDLTLYGGLRYALYAFMGPATVRNYSGGIPLDPVSLKDTATYRPWQVAQTYHGPEWRVNLRYRLSGRHSLKWSYNRLRQYLNMLSNTTAVSPTDTWKLSDRNIRPPVGDQLTLGYYLDFPGQRVETSVEIYYKHIRDMIDYKGGAQLIMNEAIEQDLLNGTGRAYGAEFMVRRTAGKLNGWISYTYSRVLFRTESEFPVEQINNGEWFPANHDKPHDLTLVSNYRFSRRLSISSNVTYSTGRPITYPVARYTVRNMTLLHYTRRNEYRIPDYFRWDLSVNVEGNLRSRKLAHSSWSFSLYNVTGRDNVYSIYFITNEKRISGYKLSIFTRPVFTVTYNFKF